MSCVCFCAFLMFLLIVYVVCVFLCAFDVSFDSLCRSDRKQQQQLQQ